MLSRSFSQRKINSRQAIHTCWARSDHGIGCTHACDGRVKWISRHQRLLLIFLQSRTQPASVTLSPQIRNVVDQIKESIFNNPTEWCEDFCYDRYTFAVLGVFLKVTTRGFYKLLPWVLQFPSDSTELLTHLSIQQVTLSLFWFCDRLRKYGYALQCVWLNSYLADIIYGTFEA